MTIELSELQSKHFEAIKWLISDQRRSGRSTLLMMAFFERALNNPGTEVLVWDHWPEEEARRRLLDEMFNIWVPKFKKEVRDKIFFVRTGNFIFYEGPPILLQDAWE